MKSKTSELTGAALDWAVAKCLLPENWNDAEIILGDDTDYSTNWALAGPIIEREGVSINLWGNDKWVANYCEAEQYGPTPLIAAMRCYIASKLGDIIDIPEELK